MRRSLAWLVLAASSFVLPIASAQPPAGTAAPPSAAQPEGPRDPLGRDTPKGTVLGFMDAARNGNDEIATQYLNTGRQGSAAAALARQLFAVLDSRLPARLSNLSEQPQGSLSNPLRPDEDVVGTITTASGPLDLVVERVDRSGPVPVWVFSRQTLQAIPDVYDEIDLVSIDQYLPAFLVQSRIAGIRLFQWVALVLGVPVIYKLIGWLGGLLRPLVDVARRRYGVTARLQTDPMPGYLRLFLLAITIRWLVRGLELPLLERQLWWGISFFFALAAVVWMALQLNAWGEQHLLRGLQVSHLTEIPSLLRLGRRVADVLVVVAGGLLALRYLGVQETAALAGLGIGGIAVALAAQKTLENVIGGLSLIFDKAVRVGDFLKLGETVGTVDYIGLRSTRIRTLDRTMLSIPNGQVATATIETMSARDKFWFHHFVGLRYETTALQMRSVIAEINGLLAGRPGVDVGSIRVRFLRLGAFSLDIEVFAYVFARDWNRFLEIQEELLIAIMEIVERVGTEIAFPSQTLHLANRRPPSSHPPFETASGSERVPHGGVPVNERVP